MEDEYLSLLNQQLAMLCNIADLLRAPKLGLHESPRRVTIYANRTNGCLWYTLKDGNPIPIAQDALTGYVEDLKFEKVERRGKEVWKLHLSLSADRDYLLESGHDSLFSKGLLAALAVVPAERLRLPITICPQPGDDESVLFCNVYLGSERIMTEWNDGTNWKEVSNAALTSVRAAASSRHATKDFLSKY